MRNFLFNLLIKVIGLLFLVICVVWVAVIMPILLISTVMTLLLCNYDFENYKVIYNEVAEKIHKWALDLLVLPYKIFGYNNFNDYINWVSSFNI